MLLVSSMHCCLGHYGEVSWLKLLVTRSMSRWGRPKGRLVITDWCECDHFVLLPFVLSPTKGCKMQERSVQWHRCFLLTHLCKWGFLTIEKLRSLFILVNLLEHRKWVLQKGFSCRWDHGQVGWFCSQVALMLLGVSCMISDLKLPTSLKTSVYVEVSL